MINELQENAELIKQLRENITTLYTVAGSIIVSLLGAVGILWTKLNKTLDTLEAKNQSVKEEYKDNMNLFFELKLVLEGLSSGVKTDLPKNISDLKEHLSEKIKDLNDKIK